MVLAGLAAAEGIPAVKQPTLIMRTRLETAEDVAKLKAALPNGKFVDIDDYANDLFAAAPKTLAKQVGTFLSG